MPCPEELAATVTAAAIAISKAVDIDGLLILSVAFSQLGDTLATLAEARSQYEKKRDDNQKQV